MTAPPAPQQPASNAPASDTPTSRSLALHWRRTRLLTGVLAVIWFAITFTTVFFARELSAITFFGWPLSFYMVAQGSVLLYLLLTGVYAWRMDRLDRQCRQPDRSVDGSQ